VPGRGFACSKVAALTFLAKAMARGGHEGGLGGHGHGGHARHASGEDLVTSADAGQEKLASNPVL
jgi:hypothetical protein